MDWEFFWIILVVIGLDGYLYWHFNNIFNMQFDLTNKLLAKLRSDADDKTLNEGEE